MGGMGNDLITNCNHVFDFNMCFGSTWCCLYCIRNFSFTVRVGPKFQFLSGLFSTLLLHALQKNPSRPCLVVVTQLNRNFTNCF